jgi:hypothetical protein
VGISDILASKGLMRQLKLSNKYKIAVFGVLFMLWAAATGCAYYSCSDLCTVCGQIQPSFITYAGKCCNCPGIDKPVGDGCDNGGTYIGFEEIQKWYQSTQRLDIAMLYVAPQPLSPSYEITPVKLIAEYTLAYSLRILRAFRYASKELARRGERARKFWIRELVLECILTPSRDLAYMEGAAPINPTCVQLLHQLVMWGAILKVNYFVTIDGYESAFGC